MAKLGLGAAIAALMFVGSAEASTTMPLDTGYNYLIFGPYGIPPNLSSSVTDQYWIKIASYEPPLSAVTVAPAFVLNPALTSPPWAPLFAPAVDRWIGAKSNTLSAPGVSQYTPGYSIYRKCFCLMAGYKNPSISINRVRADDDVQVWLNSVRFTLLGPVSGAWWNTPGLTVPTNNNPQLFRVGRNCLYVLVEDRIGHTGFTLTGSVTADGLMPAAASGVEMNFKPCDCPPAQPGTPGTPGAAVEPEADGAAMLKQIVRIAERRRSDALRSLLTIAPRP